MTHLYIELNTGLTEEVNSSIISKLYELAISGDLDETSNLKGRLHSTVARDTHVAYLNANYPDLHVSADTLYITFEDPEVDRILSNFWGDGNGITNAQIATKTTLDFSGTDSTTGREPFTNNTTVRTFPELGNFTTIKTVPYLVFENASNLESIDLSNIQYIGWQSFCGTKLTGTLNLPSIINLGNTGSQQGDSFKYCAHITSVVFGPNTTIIGNGVFWGCTEIQTVTGLSDSNLSTLGSDVFNGCTALTSVDVKSSVEFREGLFSGCTSLLSIGTWVNDTVSVGIATFRDCENLVFPDTLIVNFKKYTYVENGVTALMNTENHNTFRNCKKLKRVVLQGTDIQLGAGSFGGCTSLTEIVNTDKIKWVGIECFDNCPISGTLDLSGCDGCSHRNSGSDPARGFKIISNMPNITKVIFGGWVDTFAGEWATFAYDRSFFYNCPNLTTVDFGIIDVPFPNYRRNDSSTLFANCSRMTTLIIRNTSVLLLNNVDDIVDPKDIGGIGVTLYVPDAIVNDYKTAAGWSNIASLIKGISELPSQ